MNKRAVFYLLIVIIALPIILSCQRIDTASIEGELTSIQLSDLKAIPLGYGDLVAVTSPSTHPDWAHLWFVDQDRTIRMVRVGFADGRLHEKVTVITRN